MARLDILKGHLLEIRIASSPINKLCNKANDLKTWLAFKVLGKNHLLLFSRKGIQLDKTTMPTMHCNANNAKRDFQFKNGSILLGANILII